MKIPFTNIEVSPKQALAAAATVIGTLWAGLSLLFGSAPVTAANTLLTTAATNAVTNGVAFAGYFGKDHATNAASKLYNAATTSLNALKDNAPTFTPTADITPAKINASVVSFEPRRSARLAAKHK